MNSEKQKDLIRLQHWYHGPLGKRFAEMEHGILEELLAQVFGYYIVAFRLLSECDFLSSSAIQKRYYLRWVQCSSPEDADVVAQPDYLPIANDCIDAVVLPHVLEFSEDPIAVLREMDRILIPEGHVIIAGFNPISLWGPRINKKRFPGEEVRWIPVRTLSEWLAASGFEVVQARYGFYRPPSGKRIILEKLAFLETLGARWWPRWGGGYVILAKKRVSTLTLIRPRWRSRRRLLTEGVINRVGEKRKGDQPR